MVKPVNYSLLFHQHFYAVIVHRWTQFWYRSGFMLDTQSLIYERALRPSNAKNVINGREKHELGEIKEENEWGRCCYFVWSLPFNLSDLVGPTSSIKTPAIIAIRSNEVRNPPPQKRWQHTGVSYLCFLLLKGLNYTEWMFCISIFKRVFSRIHCILIFKAAICLPSFDVSLPSFDTLLSCLSDRHG